MKDSIEKRLLRDRSIEVDLRHAVNDWSFLTVAKIDTGADKCSIDEMLAEALGWEILGEKIIRNANGRVVRDYGRGPVVIEGVQFLMVATYADRTEMSHPLLIGHDLISDLLTLYEEE